jgi:hypothetical protein
MSALAAVIGGIFTTAAIGFRTWPVLGAAGFFFVMSIVIEVRNLSLIALSQNILLNQKRRSDE